MEPPEGRALQENLSRFSISAATARKDRDLLFATWRDILHEYLQSLPGQREAEPKMVHLVIDSIDEFLRRSKHDAVW